MMKNISAVSCLHFLLLSVIGLMIAGCQPRTPVVVEAPPAPVTAAFSTPSQPPTPTATPTTHVIPTPSSTPSPYPTPVEGVTGGMILVKTLNESGYISRSLFYQPPGASAVPLADGMEGIWLTSISPDGARLLFTAGDLRSNYLKGDSSIPPVIAVFTLSLDSGLITSLTDSAYFNINPDWSPDGQQVVYTETHNNTGNIVRVDADGTHSTRLTTDGVSYMPRWSPEGTEIAFLRKTSSDRAHIYLMDTNGENIRQITSGEVEDGFMGDITWSPDGRYLAFTRSKDGPNVNPNDIALFVIDIATGELALIDPGPSKLPAWSPDGQLAYIHGTYGSPSSSTVIVLENDLSEGLPTSIEEVRTHELAYYPEQQIDHLQWSPDSTLIHYSLKDALDYHEDTVIMMSAGTGEVLEQIEAYDFLHWLPVAAPDPAAKPDCPAGPSQLDKAQQAVLAANRVSNPLRVLPGTHPLQIGEIEQGTLLTLIERACAPDRIYWRVGLPNGQQGWTPEGDGQQVWLEP